jgi:hypothetical protein
MTHVSVRVFRLCLVLRNLNMRNVSRTPQVCFDKECNGGKDTSALCAISLGFKASEHLSGDPFPQGRHSKAARGGLCGWVVSVRVNRGNWICLSVVLLFLPC